MARNPSLSGFTLLLFLPGALLHFSCISSVEVSTDYSELESVWQYLRAYSIYQSRLDSLDHWEYNTPKELLKAVRDTFTGTSGVFGDYTRYTEVPTGTYGYVKSAGSLPVCGTTFKLNELTDSTIQMIIKDFSDGEIEYDRYGNPDCQRGCTYDSLLRYLPEIEPYSVIIVDMRRNGGGDIDVADSIVEAFLPADIDYIYARERVYTSDTRKAYTEPASGWHPWTTKRPARPELQGKRITVLMDNITASASEILASALVEGRDAVLVGATSFGKAIGQITLRRHYRPELMITFLQLKGISNRIGEYHRRGIDPDVEASGSDAQNLLTAVQVHEPGVRTLRKIPAALPASTRPAGYRIVYEE